jgi:16S rRNA (cytidine1402-2'-O)-methyltransferase
MTRGRLYLVPNLLGVVAPETVLPARTIAVARSLACYVVENAKPARAFLKTLAPDVPLREIQIIELGESPSAARCAELLAPARSGIDVGLLSDAGCPGVADPGAALVAQAHREGVDIAPLVGPSAVLLALMASGMNGQAFTFHGYLPVSTEARSQAIRRIESDSQRSGYTQIFIETPYRNVTLLETLVATCKPATRLCAAADLTTPSEKIVSRTVREWRGVDLAGYSKRPAIFVLQA